MNETEKYDVTNPLSIQQYSQKLIGKTFMDVINDAGLDEDIKASIIAQYGNPKRKGGLGNLLEEIYFGYKANSDQEPDFPEAGVELKVTPYEIRKKGNYSAGERLVITMISYQQAVEEDFYASHAYKKLKLTLLIYYLRNRAIPKMEYPIDFVTLFSPPEEDLKIIQQDYNKIITKVKDGKAHELSEGDTMYLGACTKGSNSVKSNVSQEFYAPETKARKRAFCFKQSYMTYILNKYIREKVDTYESILSSVHDIESKTFEEIIVEKINKYQGKTDQQLMAEFDVKAGAKSLWSSLAYRMLGIKSNRVEEFEKANIEVKTIRLNEKGKMDESISFPSITLKEFAQEEWEDSKFYNDLSSKRYLLVVFRKQGSHYTLQGCQLWNIANKDLEEARKGWESIQKIVQDGVELRKKYRKDGIGFRVTNNFPEKKANRIIHIRPHTSERYYILENGEKIGNNPAYGDSLPDGRVMTKQCFWLNNTYILSQLDENLKK
ncbi:restriction endonuclease (plasmid) [Priestia filamentosa]|uniref:Restriction endonuclease n=1 Tax=Priestia filamentosa TaxID=1402861 RepID=A0A2L1FFP1_9BACI|nr:Sau3AI family type II restriction endonuclease [Priestia filamentosa]AVD54548.1 restriction endonuclease [Priestia filamentosa]AVD54604.1 restriction endonuclease [Priestia filamentosa]AWG44885.1 restriction endonuclease [Priestia filamentosa]